jgi:hypothetical protein
MQYVLNLSEENDGQEYSTAEATKTLMNHEDLASNVLIMIRGKWNILEISSLPFCTFHIHAKGAECKYRKLAFPA